MSLEWLPNHMWIINLGLDLGAHANQRMNYDSEQRNRLMRSGKETDDKPI